MEKNKMVNIFFKEEYPEIKSLFTKKNYKVVEFDMKNISSKEEILSYLARKLIFPTYFGHNWDALEECLRDLAWLKESKFLFVFLNLPQQEKNKKFLLAFLEIILEAAVHHKKVGKKKIEVIILTQQGKEDQDFISKIGKSI